MHSSNLASLLNLQPVTTTSTSLILESSPDSPTGSTKSHPRSNPPHRFHSSSPPPSSSPHSVSSTFHTLPHSSHPYPNPSPCSFDSNYRPEWTTLPQHPIYSQPSYKSLSNLHHQPPSDQSFNHSNSLSSVDIHHATINNPRPLKNTKRAAQNRAAQRAFRERKDRYLRDLETRSAQFDAYVIRHGLLDERERKLEAREAIISSSLHPSNLRDANRLCPSSTPEEQQSLSKTRQYIIHLEDQLEQAHQEIDHLRKRLASCVKPTTPQNLGDTHSSQLSITRPNTQKSSYPSSSY